MTNITINVAGKDVDITKDIPTVEVAETLDAYVMRALPELVGKGMTAKEAFEQANKIYDEDVIKQNEKKEADNAFSIHSKFIKVGYTAEKDFEVDGVVIEKGTELRKVTGIVLEPEVRDLQGDIYSADEIAKSAHDFMADYTGQGNGLMHQMKAHPLLKIVESYIAPVDMVINSVKIKKGTWLMTTWVLDDKIWKAVKTKQITGYSIGGTSNVQAGKSVSKSKKETAKARRQRLFNIKTKEVSLVDMAANNKKWLIIKRVGDSEMAEMTIEKLQEGFKTLSEEVEKLADKFEGASEDDVSKAGAKFNKDVTAKLKSIISTLNAMIEKVGDEKKDDKKDDKTEKEFTPEEINKLLAEGFSSVVEKKEDIKIDESAIGMFEKMFAGLGYKLEKKEDEK